jgi:protein-disulfide isomerase
MNETPFGAPLIEDFGMITMDINRRRALRTGLMGIGSLPLLVSGSLAQQNNFIELLDDNGKLVPNYRLPSELSIDGLPGIVWTGSATPDVILVEFFDYNCPFCRKAAVDFDPMLAKDKNLRLGLVNNAILGLGSVQAAKVQQAVLKLYGPKRAYEFHQKLLSHRGANDGPVALQITKAMGLDVAKVEAAGDGEDVITVLKRQRGLAADLGFVATPSFMLKGVGILGYPGPQTIGRMIAAIKTCDKLAC